MSRNDEASKILDFVQIQDVTFGERALTHFFRKIHNFRKEKEKEDNN